MKKRDPAAKSGVYTLQLPEGPTKVRCDMARDGGGWALVYKIGAKDVLSSSGTARGGTSRGAAAAAARHGTPRRTLVQHGHQRPLQ